GIKFEKAVLSNQDGLFVFLPASPLNLSSRPGRQRLLLTRSGGTSLLPLSFRARRPLSASTPPSPNSSPKRPPASLLHSTNQHPIPVLALRAPCDSTAPTP